MENSLVSVLMLTYNHENFVGQAIESVLNQKTNFPYELIIGEDFSSDSTRDICIEFASKNPVKVKLLTSQTNLGILANFARVLNTSSGDYISFCEGDDYWSDPLKLQKQVDFLTKYPDYSLVYTNKKVLVGETLYDEQPSTALNINLIESLLISNSISFLTVLVRAEVLRECVKSVIIIANEKHWNILDYPIAIFIAMNFKFGFINEDTVVYRLLPESVSHSANKKKAYLFHKNSLEIKEFYYAEYLKKNPNIKRNFKFRFQENVFHLKKKLLFDYGMIAKSEFFSILKTYPLVYFYIIFNKLKTIFNLKGTLNADINY